MIPSLLQSMKSIELHQLIPSVLIASISYTFDTLFRYYPK